MNNPTTIGFIGLGVMGEPMCRNITAKHAGKVQAFDLNLSSRQAVSDTTIEIMSSTDELLAKSETVFLSLPGSEQVESICQMISNIDDAKRKVSCVIDLSTTSVSCAQRISALLSGLGIDFADAPVARTREAAQRAELSIMVGAPETLFAKIQPLLSYIGTDITHCGPAGSGQFVKLINNALLDVNVIALAEAIVLAEKSGFDPSVMLGAVAKGSGDSYALRNHAVKSMLPRDFPEKSFPPEYKVKDLGYLLELAQEKAVHVRSFELALECFEQTIKAGYSGRYFTAVIEAIENWDNNA